MASQSDGDQVSIPEALMVEVRAAATDARRPVSEILLGLIEDGLAVRRWNTHSDRENQRARDAGLPDDPLPLTDTHRETLRTRIAQGIRSLRDGDVEDGDAFMARMDAELAEIERHGR